MKQGVMMITKNECGIKTICYQCGYQSENDSEFKHTLETNHRTRLIGTKFKQYPEASDIINLQGKIYK